MFDAHSASETALATSEPSPIARLEDRVRAREAELERSLAQLDEAVRSHMPAAALKREVDEDPYRAVALAAVCGLVLGALI